MKSPTVVKNKPLTKIIRTEPQIKKKKKKHKCCCVYCSENDSPIPPEVDIKLKKACTIFYLLKV